MTRHLLPLAFASLAAIPFAAQAESWTRVNSADELAGGARCLVLYETSADSYALSTEQGARNRAAMPAYPVDGTLAETPEGAAIVDVQPLGGLFTFYATNGDAVGYLSPAAPSDGYNGLITVDEPVSASVSITDGAAAVTFTSREDRNELSVTSVFGGATPYAFACLNAAFDLGNLALYKSDEQGDVPPVQGDAFTLVTSQSQLGVGAEVLVAYVNGETTYMMSTAQGATARGSIELGALDSTLAEAPADAAIVRLGETAGYYSLYVTNGDAAGYVGPTLGTGKNNFCVSEEPLPAAISVSETGAASVIYQNQEERNVLTINMSFGGPSSWVFACCQQAFDGGRLVLYARGGDPDNIPGGQSGPGTGLDVLDLAWSADPADGSTVDSLGVIDIAFDGVASIDFSETASIDAVTCTLNGNPVGQFSFGPFGTNSFNVGFRPYDIETKGTVVLVVPAGFFELTLEDGTKGLSPAVEYNVNISGNGGETPEITWTADPAEGSSLKAIESFSFTFEGVASVELNEDATTDNMEATLNGTAVSLPNSSYRGNPLSFSYRNPLEGNGEFQFFIAEGTFDLTLDDGTVVPSPEITYTLLLDGDTPVTVDWSAEPADGSTVSAVETFSFTFSNVESVELSDDADMDMIAAYIDYEDVAAPQLHSRQPATFVYREPLTGEGQYQFWVAEGFWNLTLADGSVVPSPEIIYTLNFEAAQTPEPEQIYTVSPEPGEYDVYPAVTLTYEGCTYIELMDEEAVATLAIDSDLYDFDITVADNTVTLTPREEISNWKQYASYVLTVPAGTYVLGYDEVFVLNKEVTITDFTITQPLAPALVANPEAGKEYADWNVLTEIHFTSEWRISNINTFKRVALYSLSEDGERTKVGNYTISRDADQLGFTATLQLADGQTLPDGKYEVEVPAQAYMAYDEANDRALYCGLQIFSYTIDINSAVEGIAADEAFDIYTLSGICVARRAAADTIGALPAGIYIINGKKVSIRR